MSTDIWATAEPGIRPAGKKRETCPAKSPGGWNCCREKDHGGPHIGSTADWGALWIWGPRGGRILP